ncbi:hypothetical protein BD289DRAFT_423745 [Coniella lustricola]|uniref:Uncharacterized protein n=1 Tax=Coniella lustricola TaxID=2025994 RepID=A0A2T3AJH2_9PEZI|nr:hypothetical protein BD289DRAFT_423745 [Coniella lustricola]
MRRTAHLGPGYTKMVCSAGPSVVMFALCEYSAKPRSTPHLLGRTPELRKPSIDSVWGILLTSPHSSAQSIPTCRMDLLAGSHCHHSERFTYKAWFSDRVILAVWLYGFSHENYRALMVDSKWKTKATGGLFGRTFSLEYRLAPPHSLERGLLELFVKVVFQQSLSSSFGEAWVKFCDIYVPVAIWAGL